MADAQTTLIDSAAGAPRPTSKGIGAGDIVEIDKRGRRFHALVTELEPLESGRFELALRPLDSRISYAHAPRVRGRVRRGLAARRVASVGVMPTFAWTPESASSSPGS